MYNLEYLPSCKNIIKKATKRNSELRHAIERQILKIIENPRQGKPLSGALAGKWRVHALGCYVLIYTFDDKTVYIEKFEHHDRAY